MGFRGARRHHHPAQLFLLDDLGDGLLGVLGAGVEVVRGEFDVRQRFRIFGHRGHIHDTGDVDPAAADEDPDARALVDHIGFGHEFSDLGHGVAGGAEDFAGGGGRRTGVDDRLGDVLGALEGTADKDPFLGGRHRVEGARPAEAPLAELDAHLLGDLHNLGGDLHADRKHDQVEDLGGQFARLGDVADFQVVAAADRVDRVHAAADETHAVLLFGAVVEAFEILAVRAHVHEEDGAVQLLVLAGVLLGDDGLLDGVHAAHRGAVGVVALVHVPRADALEPGDFLRFLVVGQTHQVAARGAGGRQHALHLHGGDHIREIGVVVTVELGGVERLEARRQDDGADINLDRFVLHRCGRWRPPRRTRHRPCSRRS